MNYSSLKECILDLEKNNQLIRVPEEVDPHLEMAEIHRQVFDKQGPAIYFEKVKGSPFPAVSNLFGTLERARFIFRKNLPTLKKAFDLKANPKKALKKPWNYLDLLGLGIHSLPRKVSHAPILENMTTIDQLPQIQSWPDDGGPFVLLPQVYTEDIQNPGIMKSNLGMYRIQLSGNEYETNKEIGLHYQIRRDIGIHHTNALNKKKPLRVSIFVGGPPAHTFSAVMYLPEGMPEVAFAGALGGRAFRYCIRDGFVLSADADFCITGWVEPGALKPEGPFGDHLGYYSLKHAFPYMKVEKVYHRTGAIWPFTVVGRPPQEDTSFGKLIQEIAGPVISTEIAGIKSVHAVDAAGVHPLLLAIGKERFTPYEKRKPQELLKEANALLGYGPCSLAKYLFIASEEDNQDLGIHDCPTFFKHVLERVDFSRDLHFQTKTTIDTLDYSGTAINEGSKVVIAAAGEKKRELNINVPMPSMSSPNVSVGDPCLPAGRALDSRLRGNDNVFDIKFVSPGIVAIKAGEFSNHQKAIEEISQIEQMIKSWPENHGVALVTVCDDPEFVAGDFKNFLWVTFTRSNPSHDIYGVESSIQNKHWGCEGPLVIDARIKPHHAPVCKSNPQITDKVKQYLKNKCLEKALNDQ